MIDHKLVRVAVETVIIIIKRHSSLLELELLQLLKAIIMKTKMKRITLTSKMMKTVINLLRIAIT